MPEHPPKTSKTGHFGVLRNKSSDCCLEGEKITQSNRQEEEKIDKIHACSIPFSNELIFFNMNNYQSLLGKTEKISQYSVGSATPSCFGTDHVTVLSTPPRKTEYTGVLQHRYSCALDLCSACLE